MLNSLSIDIRRRLIVEQRAEAQAHRQRRRRVLQSACPRCTRRRRRAPRPRQRAVPARLVRNAARGTRERERRDDIRVAFAGPAEMSANVVLSLPSQGTAGNVERSASSQGTAGSAERSVGTAGNVESLAASQETAGNAERSVEVAGNAERSASSGGTAGETERSASSQGTSGETERSMSFQGTAGETEHSVADEENVDRVTRAEVLEIIDHYATYDEVLWMSSSRLSLLELIWI